MAIAPSADFTQMTQIRMNNSGLKVLKKLNNNIINNQFNVELNFLLIIGYGQLTNVSQCSSFVRTFGKKLLC